MIRDDSFLNIYLEIQIFRNKTLSEFLLVTEIRKLDQFFPRIFKLLQYFTRCSSCVSKKKIFKKISLLQQKFPEIQGNRNSFIALNIESWQFLVIIVALQLLIFCAAVEFRKKKVLTAFVFYFCFFYILCFCDCSAINNHGLF